MFLVSDLCTHSLGCLQSRDLQSPVGVFLRDCVREGCGGPGSCAPSAMRSVCVQLFLTNDVIIHTPQSYPQIKPIVVTRHTAAITPTVSANDSIVAEHVE